MGKNRSKITLFGLKKWKVIAILLAVYDFVAIHFAYFLALWFRFDCRYSEIPHIFLKYYIRIITPYALISLVLFFIFRMYSSMWRFTSVRELLRICWVSAFTSAGHIIAITLIFGRMPIIYYVLGSLFQFLFVAGARLSFRIVYMIIRGKSKPNVAGDNIMLIGAGSAGQMILRDINNSREITDRVVCIIDDDSNKWNRFIGGVPIVGGRDDILYNAKEYKIDKIFIAIPSAPAAERRDIINICNETGCELKQLPGMYQFILGQVKASAMKNVTVEDLLGREPIKTNLSEVFDFIRGKVVMVTGGGGSIGSELCRQIAGHQPKTLIIFDVYENNLYDIQLELKEKYPKLDLHALVGSVRDSRKMFEVFSRFRPEIVYHAAAHKHVPLMEDSPCEAIKNNAIGTYKTAYAAMVHGCKRFVLISTDKAVNPTNIMGASKRLCEMIIQSFDEKIKQGRANEIPQLFTHTGSENADKDGTGSVFKDIKTEFVAVRFGNVLGSNGSVVPLFKKQIEKGGPVTVTHPEIIRYFMTIPEAVSLVLQAGTYAHGGEIFVLDMGSPVKIDTLARNLIKLSGFRPDIDIKVEYTGLRPGEKLYEEKLMAEEGLKKTENEMIHIGCPIPFDADEFFASLEGLMCKAYTNSEKIRDIVKKIVVTYHPEDEGKKPAKGTEFAAVIEGDGEDDE
jgi:FlaA1/EpsC-like NDP-sugar epimerase